MELSNITESFQHGLATTHTTPLLADAETGMSNNEAKLLAILALGFGSFISGILPLFIAQRNRERFPVLISFLLCFGAGVLLATALVHMLPEVRDGLKQYAEIVFCIGFFLIYTVDEISHLFGAGGHGHSHGEQPVAAVRRVSRDSTSGDLDNGRSYGTSEETKLLSKSESSIQIPQRSAECDGGETSENIVCSNENLPRVMVAAGDPEEQVTGVFSLLLALVVHSLLEGLAIGVQSSAPQVLLLLGAVSAHKYVVGFCLGVEICTHGSRHNCSHVLQILTFSIGSVAGIAVGMVLDDIGQTFNMIVIPILQGVAGGTLLYVTVSEVLPRERGKRGLMRKRQVGLLQLFAVMLGFTVMSILSLSIAEK
ncbi:zinc transporter ZIP3 [Topomyia yanbarensis]|uniref:zinc transporter ZIP3 n=1 Tax=Topomyia yanbarensis TaxID=2498891 RepID=UPI00273CF4D2|nr:zinc transporter ZIP3 [Topomyia yanbarensis]XP_058824582.1 zinc transporter ZIP3 [Topomyia yanbarensis]XP_058824583.1 zinc transporter ZIP3 [Topomyia yanbarensis]XP_058824584.1 zinc transporter ZIP3 [Topomyia yanbarensis]XP_058824586.1 zinc transporter ZIP3 [Topomyia yanbarensis]